MTAPVVTPSPTRSFSRLIDAARLPEEHLSTFGCVDSPRLGQPSGEGSERRDPMPVAESFEGVTNGEVGASSNGLVRVRPVDLVPGDVIVGLGEPYTVLDRALPSRVRGVFRSTVRCDRGVVSWPLDDAARFESVTIMARPARRVGVS